MAEEIVACDPAIEHRPARQLLSFRRVAGSLDGKPTRKDEPHAWPSDMVLAVARASRAQSRSARRPFRALHRHRSSDNVRREFAGRRGRSVQDPAGSVDRPRLIHPRAYLAAFEMCDDVIKREPNHVQDSCWRPAGEMRRENEPSLCQPRRHGRFAIYHVERRSGDRSPFQPQSERRDRERSRARRG